jgi:pimeloyl-ACP methyl ester carboxylesterase
MPRRIASILIALFAALLAVLVAIVRLILPRWERLDWSSAPRPGKLIDIDGVRLHYVEDGRGPAVVMIHGFGGHTFSFRHTVPALAKRFRVVAIDLKGFGFSERPKGGDYSLREQARLVLRLMHDLKIERAAIVGHSMGGEVAMRVAATAPECADRVVLAASVSGERIWTPPPTRPFKVILMIVARLFGGLLFRRMFYDPNNATEGAREGYRAPTRIRGYGDALYELAKDVRHDPRIDYGAIRAPVLILWAEHDRILPRLVLGRLKRRLPRADVVTIQKAGHLLLEERPKECNEAILRFLVDGRGEAPEAAEPVDGTMVQS